MAKGRADANNLNVLGNDKIVLVPDISESPAPNNAAYLATRGIVNNFGNQLQSNLATTNPSGGTRLKQIPPTKRVKSQGRKSKYEISKLLPPIERKFLDVSQYPESVKRAIEKYTEIDRPKRMNDVGFEIEVFQGKKWMNFTKLGISVIAEDVSTDKRDMVKKAYILGGRLPQEIDLTKKEYDPLTLYPNESEFDKIIVTIPVDDIQAKGVIFGLFMGIKAPCRTGGLIGENMMGKQVTRTFRSKSRKREIGTVHSALYHIRIVRKLK